ncbi:MAG TPA: hypothetical protein VGF06_12065 [Terriglobales bacterium]|jgi:hypothetical protein
MRQYGIVPSIGSHDVASAEWPDVRSFEHLLQLLNVANNALDVHRFQYSEPGEWATRQFL